MEKQLGMEKVFEYAIKHLEKRIANNRSYSKRTTEGSKANIMHNKNIVELEKELEEIKKLKENI